MPVNEHAQPIGVPLVWTPGESLVPVTLHGRSCRLVPLEEQHVDGLHAALCLDSPPSTWTYMSSGPFEGRAGFAAYVERLQSAPDVVPLVVLLPAVGQSGEKPGGIATYLRVDHSNGTAEVGHIVFGAELQRSTAATEAMFLMMSHAFDVLGVRRYEWKCDSLNEPSRRAATRLGFTFEGIFRQAVVYKARNRDTAWYAVTDNQWPEVRAGFERWLDPANFDKEGRQRASLSTQRPSEKTPPTTDQERPMAEDKTALSGIEIAEAGLEGWCKVLDRLAVRFETGDFNTGAALVTRIAEAADRANHHPDVDLRYPHLTVSLKSHDVDAITARDLRLATEISSLAKEAGVGFSTHGPDVLELALDTADHERIAPFWAAIMGYDAEGDAISDPAGRLPNVWFQATDSAEVDRQRWHLDVSVPHDAAAGRIEAAVAAGGTLVSDESAPAFWVLADPDGNRACICTWQSRD